jgi:FlaG/FlaF family flagellin (archaellin)
MNKKGISPFIATVLLIGAAVILSVIVAQFMRGFSNDRTDEVERQAEISHGCSKSTLTFQEICINGADLKFNVKNEGSYGVRNISLTYFLDGGDTEIGVLDTTPPGDILLGRFGFASVTVTPGFTPSVGIIEKIKYVKTIDLEDGTTGQCAAVEFNVNSVEECEVTPPPICVDEDTDGYGSPASSSCTHPELDCDDSDPNINPGETEVCGDGIDNNCDLSDDC